MTAARRFFLTAFAALCLGTFCEAKGDTLIFGGAEIRFPDEGWYVVFTGGTASIVNKEENLLVEVYRFAKVPSADKESIAEAITLGSGITAVKILTVKKRTQHGVLAMVAEGTAKTATATVDVRLVGIPVGDLALVAVAYVPQKDDKNLRTMENILKSIKIRVNSSDGKKANPDVVAIRPGNDPSKDRKKPSGSQQAEPEPAATNLATESRAGRFSRIRSRVRQVVRRVRVRGR